jgi:hypothetical protein
VPETVSAPHCAEKSPAIDVSVWLVIFHWTLPHAVAATAGTDVADAHVPTYDDVGTGFGVVGVVAEGVVAVGVLVCCMLQPPESTVAEKMASMSADTRRVIAACIGTSRANQ